MLPPELDVSGGKASRPILDGAISAVERGEADGIIVSQIDRLSRMAMSSALTVIERIEGAGGQVIAVAENVDPTTPEGRMARNMFLSLAAMQRERNADAIADAKARAEVEAARVQRDAFLTLDIDDPVVAQAELDRRQERLDAAENHLALLHPPDSLDSSVVGEWPGLTLGERREVLALGIDAVFLRRAPRQGLSAIDDRALVLWRGEGPADLPGPGRRGVPLVPYEW